MVGSRVYVGGLPFGVRERDLEKFFKGFGRTRDILIKNGYGFVEFEDYRDADDAVYELNGKELLGERVVVEPARGIDRGDRGRRDRERDRFSSRDRYGRPPAPRYEVSLERARGTPRGADRWRCRDLPPPPPPRRPRERERERSRALPDKYGPPTRTEYRLTVENLSSRVSWQDLKDYMRQAGEVTYADAHKQHRNEGVVEFASSSDLRAAMEKLDNTELNGRRIRLVEDRRGGGGGGSRRRSRSSSSRSRSRSRARRTRTRSRSRSARRSRTASRSASRSKSRAKTKSPVAKSRSRSKARSASPHSRSASPVRRSRSPVRRSRSKSASPHKSASRERSRSASKGASPRGERKAPSKSRSRSRSRSHSGSPPPRENGGRASSEAK